MAIFLTVFRVRRVIDKKLAKKVAIQPGRHEMERIPDPDGLADHPWLVLQGTMTGQSEAFWRAFLDDADPQDRVEIEEQPV